MSHHRAITTHLRNEATHAVELGGTREAFAARTRSYLSQQSLTLQERVTLANLADFNFALAEACHFSRKNDTQYAVVETPTGDYHVEPSTKTLDDLGTTDASGYALRALVTSRPHQSAAYLEARARAGFFGLETLLIVGLLAVVGLCATIRETKRVPTPGEAAGTVIRAASSQVGR
jgi:hypothetical protein